MILTSLHIDPAAFAERTGWAIKPQGACKGEACVPLPANARQADGTLDARVLSERLGMPLVEEAGRSLWALGPESGVTGRALTTAIAPELVLPDVDGKPFRLSSLRGKKVLLTTWASWCGCRTDLPLWQKLREKLYPQGLEIVTVALDTEGAKAARQYIEAAQPEHPSLIDAGHLVDELFGVVNVPNGVWINEEGVIVRPAEPAWPGYTKVSEWKDEGMNANQRQMLTHVRKIRYETDLYLEMLLDWVAHGSQSRYVLAPDEVIARSQPRSADNARAAAHFELGQHLHTAGDHAAAVPHWRQAHRLQPDNWTYKRQAWSIEDPGSQHDTDAYDSNWLKDVEQIGAENYYPKIVA
nr:ResA-like WAxxUGC motif-containing protein [uncultured Albidiferax sp.]